MTETESLFGIKRKQDKDMSTKTSGSYKTLEEGKQIQSNAEMKNYVIIAVVAIVIGYFLFKK